ncbi:MAG: glycosyltransferase family 4 protein [Rubrobacteraceae bacterium]
MKVVNVLFDDRYGGPQKRVLQVAKSLAGCGVQTVLCLPEGKGNTASIALEGGVDVSRVPFGRIPRPRELTNVLRWLFGLPGDVRRFMELFRRELPDVVHVNGAFFLAPAIAAKLAKIPLVWHLNDTVVPSRAAVVFGVLVRGLADRIVVAAEAVAKHYAVTASSYTVIYAPVDIEGFLVAGTEPGGTESGGTVARVGLVANWNPLKGLEYFVRAAALVRYELGSEVEFVIAGARLDTHSGYAHRVEGLIGELDLHSSVRELGFLPSVAPMLETLDVLVLSSTAEASPMVVLEGMAAGVPVVATDVGGVREMLLGDLARPAGVVVPPRDPEAMSGAILSLLNNPEEAGRLGKNGRRLAEERFSLEICARRHLEVYESLAEDPMS